MLPNFDRGWQAQKRPHHNDKKNLPHGENAPNNKKKVSKRPPAYRQKCFPIFHEGGGGECMYKQ